MPLIKSFRQIYFRFQIHSGLKLSRIGLKITMKTASENICRNLPTFALFLLIAFTIDFLNSAKVAFILINSGFKSIPA